MKKVIVVAVVLLLTFGVLGGCTPKESAAVGIIGGADGPTAIFISPGCDRE